jgi:hypothetical protein
VVVVVVVVGDGGTGTTNRAGTITATGVVLAGDVVVVVVVVDDRCATRDTDTDRWCTDPATASTTRRVGTAVPTAWSLVSIDRGDARPGVANRRSGATPRARQSPSRTVGRNLPALGVLRTPPFLCGQVNYVGVPTKLGDRHGSDKSNARSHALKER